MKDFTEYPEYTYDRQVRDLEEIIKSLEAKIEKQEKQLSLYGVMHPLKTFDIHNCINDIAKVAQHRSYSVYELSKDQVFRYGCKVAIDKMLCKK